MATSAPGTAFGRKHIDVERFDEPSPNGGAYYVVYTRDDESIRTVEFTAKGAHLAEYEGEPRVLDAGEDRIQVRKRPDRSWKKPATDTPPASVAPQPAKPLPPITPAPKDEPKGK